MPVRVLPRRTSAPGSAADDTPARLRLFCLPHAGGGLGTFRGWVDLLPGDVELAVPCLPGRDARAAEPPLACMAGLVGRLADDLEDGLDKPYALFGHSLGALVAFDLAHEVTRRGGPPPTALVVSGQRAPSVPYPHKPVFRLDDDAFIDAVQARHDAIPAAILAHGEMLTHYRRLLRADFTLVEDYGYTRRARLPCPIVCIRGEDDKFVTAEHAVGWREETLSDCEFVTVPGGHFYPRDLQGPLFRILSRVLGQEP